jgi:hypothetical protein
MTTTTTETEVIPSGDVVADLHFYAAPADGSRPFNYVNTPPKGQPQSNVGKETRAVKIHDLRSSETSTSLDKEAFSFHTFPSALSYPDFGDEEKIQAVYYPEIQEIVRKYVSGAKEVLIFDHTIRRNSPNAARGPVQQVHIDQTPKSGELRLRRHVSEERADEVLKKNIRYQIINVWRPINGTVVSHPLAFADSSTVPEDDLVGVAHIYSNYEGQTAGVKYGSGQKWCYVSGHKGDEVTLIKCFDSWEDKEGKKRRVPHTAFVHPDTPEVAKDRESIEVRCLIIG